MELPVLQMTVRNIDPEWVPVFDPNNPGSAAINVYKMTKDYLVDVEVVQLNLSAGTMRVRYEWPSKTTKSGFEVRTYDTSISAFFEKYSINSLGN